MSYPKRKPPIVEIETRKARKDLLYVASFWSCLASVLAEVAKESYVLLTRPDPESGLISALVSESYPFSFIVLVMLSKLKKLIFVNLISGLNHSSL